MTIRQLPISLTAVMALVSTVAAGAQMFDPAIDRPDDQWCYAAQSTTVIGMPFVPEPVQVTYDGAVYTRYAELAFFCGKTLKPVMARNKTFRDGWIPVVEYGWKAEGVDYRLEIFSTELPELGRANLVQFARFTMTNPGPSPVEGVVAAAIRGSAGHFRLGGLREPVTPNTRFAVRDDVLVRNGRLVYAFCPGAEIYAVPDVPYENVYQAVDYHITDRAATGLSVYRRVLQPDQTFSATFKMPRVPVANPDQIAVVTAADYPSQLDKTVRYWEDLLGGCEFEIPEKRVNDSYRAALVHLILATRSQGGGRRQGSGLPYDALFLNDYIDMLLAYDTAGLYAFAEPNVDWLLRKQHPSGMFIDVHNGSTHEGFENLVVPWSTRTPAAGCPPPHAWAAAKTALFIRNMLVCESGGQAGIEEDKRDLLLYSLISPSWIETGKKVAIRNAPTEMGRISSTLAFLDNGATLSVEAEFHHAPRYLVFRIPYSVTLDSFTSDANQAFEQDGLLLFTPDVTEASIQWRPKPGAHDNNYQDVLKAYRSEFNFIVKDGNYDPARAGKPFPS